MKAQFFEEKIINALHTDMKGIAKEVRNDRH